MSSRDIYREEVSLSEHPDEMDANPDAADIVEERSELHATVEMEIQAKVDTNHPDARQEGLTLAAEERMEAREWEIERTRTRVDRAQASNREARTAKVVERESRERRVAFERRAASVDARLDPDGVDPRARLSREELAAVNQEARRIQAGISEAGSTAAISRRLAEELTRTGDLLSATVTVAEQVQTQPGTVTPISRLGDVPSREVDFEGRVAVLWEPTTSNISQVGLVEDETGRVKLTSWVRSEQPWFEEGELIRVRKAAKSWYQGRVSVALTSWSRVEFPERDSWWKPEP